MMDCRLASCPTKRSPLSVKATTDGVVLAPSALGITTGSPDCQAAITELVVPRSIPTAVAIAIPFGSCLIGVAGSARLLLRRDDVELFWLQCGDGREIA